jgi:hypothetical protein
MTMNSAAEPEVVDVSKLRAAAESAFAVLNIAVFGICWLSVWRYGALFATTGGEPLAVYPIWKALHHHPVYQWPLLYPFALGLYNYLFYDGYAFLLRVVGARDTEILLWGRIFTTAFAIAGAVAQWKLVERCIDLRGARSAQSLLLAIGLWVSTSLARGWDISVRSDIPAAALVMMALLAIVRRPRLPFLYAGVLFYLAWSFKQSEVLVLSGVCLYLIAARRWRDVAMMASIFGGLAALTLMLGSAEYRYNLLVAPRMIAWSLTWAMRIAPKTLVANAYWVLAPLAFVGAARADRTERSVASGEGHLADTVRLLMFAMAVALVGGLAGMTKVGAWNSYLLEAFCAGSTLLQLAVFAVPGWLVTGLVFLGCIQPGIQIVTRPSGAHPHAVGTVGIATAGEYADAVRMTRTMAGLKKPIFTTDELLAMPWFSSEAGVTALVIDAKYHEATRARCSNGCVEGMLQRGETPTVLLADSDEDYLKSLNAGYSKTGEAAYMGRKWSIYELNAEGRAAAP